MWPRARLRGYALCREAVFLKADVCFMHGDQVFHGFQGTVCLFSTNRRIVWSEAYRVNRSGDSGTRKRQISAAQMHVWLEWCIDEIERQFYVYIQVKQIKSDDERMLKGGCCRSLEGSGISQKFVELSVSGPFKTKLDMVERFNRTIKLFLNKLMAGYNTCDWTALLFCTTISKTNRGSLVGDLLKWMTRKKDASLLKSKKTLKTQAHYDTISHILIKLPEYHVKWKRGRKKCPMTHSRKNGRAGRVRVLVFPRVLQDLH